MREIQEILRKIEELGPSEMAVLVTVVDVQGSSYRLPGARMLSLESGRTFGTVSGGCLEADVMERAKKVFKTGESETFTYDTTNDENSIFSLNMGCRGIIRVLLERVDKTSILLNVIKNSLTERQMYVIATLISADNVENVNPANIGGRAVYSQAGHFSFDGLPTFLEDLAALRNDCARLFQEDGCYSPKVYETVRGHFEFAFETIQPPIALSIFGAGADAIPLAEIAANLGWHITVADHRPLFLTKERFPGAAELVAHNAEYGNNVVASDSQTASVVMTHNYERDREILSNLLKSDVFYIGALGPKRRTEKLLQELRDRGEKFDGELNKLFAPVGLDIGADTPETIALSIAAEIKSVLGNREGGFLRERTRSIYDRNAASV